METKPLFKSKIFWISAVGLIWTVISSALHRPYDPVTGDVEESIVDAVFSQTGNTVAIVLSVVSIVTRWFFTSTKIKGIF